MCKKIEWNEFVFFFLQIGLLCDTSDRTKDAVDSDDRDDVDDHWHQAQEWLLQEEYWNMQWDEQGTVNCGHHPFGRGKVKWI